MLRTIVFILSLSLAAVTIGSPAKAGDGRGGVICQLYLTSASFQP
jgi:hypothetical protein